MRQTLNRRIVLILSLAVAVLALWHGQLFAAPVCGDRVAYTYTVSRVGVEKVPGSLNDGDRATGISWHTKSRAKTDIVCAFDETQDLGRIEILASKWTKWFIISEIHVSLDDGIGGFGEPFVLPGLVPSPKGQKELRDASCTNHVFSIANPAYASTTTSRARS